MSRYGDTELTRLNYVLWPDESIGPHTRVDIANEAASRIATLETQLLDAKRNEERAVAEVGELKARVAELDDVQCGMGAALRLADASKRLAEYKVDELVSFKEKLQGLLARSAKVAAGWEEVSIESDAKLHTLEAGGGELRARVAELEEVEFLGVLKIGSDNRNGEHVLVWHDGVWKCACYEDAMGMWVGWYVVGGQGTRPLDPEPVYYRPLPPDLDGES